MRQRVAFFAPDTPLQLLILGWFLAMVALPITLWLFGPAALPTALLVAVVGQLLVVLTLLVRHWGWGKAIATALLVFLMGWFLEAWGTRTGWPFGWYDYTGRLQPQLGSVPLLVPLAWLMMLPVSWGVARLLWPRAPLILLVPLAATAMTAWDFLLDPQMVQWKFWLWRDAAPWFYFGIPWTNFGGWWLGSAAMTAVIVLLVRPPWRRLPLEPLWLLYTLTWFLETFGLLFFWGLPGPALVGGLIMGVLVFWSGWQLRHSPAPKGAIERA